MGQQRTDSHEQKAAKQRVADSRRCNRCGRRSAMSSQRGDYDDGHVWKVCHYCGHERGSRRQYVDKTRSDGSTYRRLEWVTYGFEACP